MERDRAQCSFRFNLQYDDQYVFFAATVIDDVFVQQVADLPARRDWVELLVDARPDPVRSAFVGPADLSEQLVFLMAPSDDPLKPHVVGWN